MIMGEIKRFLRDNGAIKVSRSLKELATKIRDVQDRNQIEGKDELTADELAKLLRSFE
jgi:RNA polymerase sporulation-specific sigma factor